MSARAVRSPIKDTSALVAMRMHPRVSPLALATLLCAICLLATLTLTSPALAAEPLDVVFVLDNSGSMKINDPAFLTRRAVSRFATALAEDDELEGRIAIVLFDEQARLVQGLIPSDEVVSKDTLSSALAALDFSGQRTHSPAGIERALYELRENGREDARQAIVFLSDGKIDTGDPRSDLEAARWLREELASEIAAERIQIFGIAFTDGADYQLMQALARRTNARYYRAYEASELGAVVEDVLATIEADPAADLAYLDSPLDGTTTPDVSAAPLDPANAPAPETGPARLGWLPIALLLVGSALYLRRRDRDLASLSPQGSAGSPTLPAHLLDSGGQLGEAGAFLALKVGRTTIGRDPRNDIVLPEDTISSEHAVIETRNGRYWLQNLRSTNGTKLAERRLSADECVPLKGGDHVRFADIDLMFVVEGYVPGGATVYLSSSTTPPADWSELADSTDASGPVIRENPREEDSRTSDDRLDVAASDAPSGEIEFAERLERLDPASVLDLDEELAGHGSVNIEDSTATDPTTDDTQARDAIARAGAILESLPDEPIAENEPDDAQLPARPREPESKAGPESDTEPEFDLRDGPTAEIRIDRDAAESEPLEPLAAVSPLAAAADSLRECLDCHLARVSEISPAFASFVERAFGEELRGALPVAAHDLLSDAQRSGRIEQREYTSDRIRYLICGVPGTMESAQQLFVESFGGFTRMLAEQLQAESFLSDRCEILALLTFGCGEAPWVSLTIVPDEGQDPRIDLLSYEFLTDDERREIEPSIDPAISQSGLA